MTKSRNFPASIRQRLLNRSRQEQRPFNELLQYYAMERFLYRLSQSEHARSYILKGALMLRVWEAPEARPTMDIDMLGPANNEPETIMKQVKDVLAASVVEDGLVFQPESLKTEPIAKDADYHGTRIRFTGSLDGARITMQLDIGFGDAVYPAAQMEDFPTLFELPYPTLLCYSRESAIAEKFEAMVKLGDLNSRMKDFYDIWLLARQFEFDGPQLAEAIRQTFARRGTTVPNTLSFDSTFIASKQPQWQAFHKRLRQSHLPTQFSEILSLVTEFLTPFLHNENAITPGTEIPKQ